MKAKRFLALLLSVVMLLGVMPMSVFAVEHVHDYTYSYTYIDGSKQHYGVCFCGEADSSNPVGCTYNDGVPGWNKAPSEDSEGKRTWECTLCHGEWQETVPAHKCTHNDIWEQDDYRYHCTHCVYPGCGAWMGEEHTNYMTGWVHEDATTLKNSCTRCGYFNSSTVESSFVFVEAKGATCSSAGNIEFYICEHCDKYFADETCQKQYNPAEVFINPTAHNYVDGVCTECSAKVTSARFEQPPEEYFSSEDEYLYVFVGMGSDGKLYAMGEATGDGRRYGVEIPGAQIDENGVITLTPAQAEFMLYEYYFENGSGASTTSTFTVDGGYMTIKNGKIYVFPKSHLDDPENPRPIDFDQADYGDDSGLGSVDADDYDPSTYTHTYEYMTFNPETLCFEACDTEQNTIYLYRQICDHANEDVVHYEYIAATCTEQGTCEYWYCSKCLTYFSNAACTQKYEFPDDIDPNDSIAVEKYFQINALCHKFAENGVCEHCAMKRNVYKPITSLEQFDQLSGEAYYIIVFKDGDKTYAAFLPDIGHINDPVTIDANNNDIVDMMEPDVNANGIPDCIESYIDEYMGSVDYNEDGIKSVEEYNEMIGWIDDDEDIDADDYKLFFENRIYWDLYYEYDYEIYDLPNIVEVTVAPDGSITIVDEGAMEFQMMPSGIFGGQENDGSELEYENIKDTDRLRAFWVPNWWIANSGTMGEYSEDHFLTQDRVFGDRAMPGVIDNKNWKISFKEDGTALLVSTWTTFDDSAALQLIKYTDADGNERITMVGCYDYLWENSEILSNCTVISGAYLYASEPVYAEPPHECIWSD